MVNECLLMIDEDILFLIGLVLGPVLFVCSAYNCLPVNRTYSEGQEFAPRGRYTENIHFRNGSCLARKNGGNVYQIHHFAQNVEIPLWVWFSNAP